MIRKAKIKDIKKIQELINFYAKKDLMLPRSLNELYENLRDFFVYEEKSKLLGCCALHVSWQDLAEVKSVAVSPKHRHKGIGTKLIDAAVNEAKLLGIKQLFALTYVPLFFKRHGFRRLAKSKLPHKIWSECIYCHKFPNCDETALIRKL
ncbi:MAG: N-acetyltransferase [Candidatus Omnitrophota bacterium]